MSAGEETYIANALKVGQLVEEMWTFDGLTSRQIESLYIRNPLATGGYDIIFNAAAALPDVTIVSVTEPAVEGEDVTVVAITPAGTLTYKFELDFSGVGTNWLTIQDSPSEVWTPAVGTEGFFWRVIVTADDGTNTDSETFTSSGRIAAPATGVLQAMQWVLTTGSGSGTVASTGLEIIWPQKTTQLLVDNGPRFWNGAESVNYGATLSGGNYKFANAQATNDWWEDNYQARIRQNGRDWMVMDGNTAGEIYANSQTPYNDIGKTPGVAIWGDWWIPQAQGQTIDIEMYAKGQIPDNWYTYQLGAGQVEFITSSRVMNYNTNYPTNNDAFKMNNDPNAGYLRTQYGGNTPGLPNYIAIFYTQAQIDATSGTFGSTQTAGWYVCQKDAYVNDYTSYLPVAWPTGGSAGDGTTPQLGNMADANGGVQFVCLSDYTGTTGNGGTDGWSAPIGSLL